MDLIVLRFFSELNAPGWLDTVMIFATRLGDIGLIWITLALILLCMRGKRSLGLCIGLALVLSFIFVNLILKNLIARERPYEMYSDIIPIIDKLQSYSFPSGHTSSSFAAAIPMLLGNKRLAVSMLFMAAMISISRIYLCMHYLTDVIAGAVIGALCAFLAVLIVRRLVKAKMFNI